MISNMKIPMDFVTDYTISDDSVIVSMQGKGLTASMTVEGLDGMSDYDAERAVIHAQSALIKYIDKVVGFVR